MVTVTFVTQSTPKIYITQPDCIETFVEGKVTPI